jgi:hypothetical protein
LIRLINGSGIVNHFFNGEGGGNGGFGGGEGGLGGEGGRLGSLLKFPSLSLAKN